MCLYMKLVTLVYNKKCISSTPLFYYIHMTNLKCGNIKVFQNFIRFDCNFALKHARDMREEIDVPYACESLNSKLLN